MLPSDLNGLTDSIVRVAVVFFSPLLLFALPAVKFMVADNI